MPTARSYIKHQSEPATFAIESDEDGVILSALDVTSDVAAGGVCPHMLASLPLAGRIDDLQYLTRNIEIFEPFVPDCGNVHHLMGDLLELERQHRQAASAYALADSRAKGLKNEVTEKAKAVHELLERITDRKPLPLFAAIGG